MADKLQLSETDETSGLLLGIDDLDDRATLAKADDGDDSDGTDGDGGDGDGGDGDAGDDDGTDADGTDGKD